MEVPGDGVEPRVSAHKLCRYFRPSRLIDVLAPHQDEALHGVDSQLLGLLQVPPQQVQVLHRPWRAVWLVQLSGGQAVGDHDLRCQVDPFNGECDGSPQQVPKEWSLCQPHNTLVREHPRHHDLRAHEGANQELVHDVLEHLIGRLPDLPHGHHQGHLVPLRRLPPHVALGVRQAPQQVAVAVQQAADVRDGGLPGAQQGVHEGHGPPLVPALGPGPVHGVLGRLRDGRGRGTPLPLLRRLARKQGRLQLRLLRLVLDFPQEGLGDGAHGRPALGGLVLVLIVLVLVLLLLALAAHLRRHKLLPFQVAVPVQEPGVGGGFWGQQGLQLGRHHLADAVQVREAHAALKHRSHKHALRVVLWPVGHKGPVCPVGPGEPGVAQVVAEPQGQRPAGARVHVRHPAEQQLGGAGHGGGQLGGLRAQQLQDEAVQVRPQLRGQGQQRRHHHLHHQVLGAGPGGHEFGDGQHLLGHGGGVAGPLPVRLADDGAEGHKDVPHVLRQHHALAGRERHHGSRALPAVCIKQGEAQARGAAEGPQLRHFPPLQGVHLTLLLQLLRQLPPRLHNRADWVGRLGDPLAIGRLGGGGAGLQPGVQVLGHAPHGGQAVCARLLLRLPLGGAPLPLPLVGVLLLLHAHEGGAQALLGEHLVPGFHVVLEEGHALLQARAPAVHQRGHAPHERAHQDLSSHVPGALVVGLVVVHGDDQPLEHGGEPALALQGQHAAAQQLPQEAHHQLRPHHLHRTLVRTGQHLGEAGGEGLQESSHESRVAEVEKGHQGRVHPRLQGQALAALHQQRHHLLPVRLQVLLQSSGQPLDVDMQGRRVLTARVEVANT
mmetsp:Transcript_4873/g.7341  ORF Transcript_4873/g.7341 Transcript_4873/m.7341 type:complete len:829 (-) Transcript_4873:92-2578(-)